MQFPFSFAKGKFCLPALFPQSNRLHFQSGSCSETDDRDTDCASWLFDPNDLIERVTKDIELLVRSDCRIMCYRDQRESVKIKKEWSVI